jgi:hypothetical protein
MFCFSDFFLNKFFLNKFRYKIRGKFLFVPARFSNICPQIDQNGDNLQLRSCRHIPVTKTRAGQSAAGGGGAGAPRVARSTRGAGLPRGGSASFWVLFRVLSAPFLPPFLLVCKPVCCSSKLSPEGPTRRKGRARRRCLQTAPSPALFRAHCARQLLGGVAAHTLCPCFFSTVSRPYGPEREAAHDGSLWRVQAPCACALSRSKTLSLSYLALPLSLVLFDTCGAGESKPRKDGGPHVVVRHSSRCSLAAGLWRCDDGGNCGYVGGVLRGRQLLCYNPFAVMAVDKLLERVHNTVHR